MILENCTSNPQMLPFTSQVNYYHNDHLCFVIGFLQVPDKLAEKYVGCVSNLAVNVSLIKD